MGFSSPDALLIGQWQSAVACGILPANRERREDPLTSQSPASPSPSPIIHLDNLTRTYQRGSEEVQALFDLTLTIEKSAFVVVLGPSGSGKSTLLNLLGGIDRPTGGQLQIAGQSLNGLAEHELDQFRRDNIGFVFQFNNLMPNLEAAENVALPLVARGMNWRPALVQAEEQLAALGLSHRRRHRPAELSGGEQQRVALARAVIAEPAIVLADEPTGDLDSQSAAGVLDLMSSLNRQRGVTFVVATHNPGLRPLATMVVSLANGRLHEASSAS